MSQFTGVTPGVGQEVAITTPPMNTTIMPATGYSGGIGANFDWQAVIDTYRRLHDQAFEANADRKGQIMDTIDLTTQLVQGQYDGVESMLQNLGVAERERINMGAQRESARAEQDLISRGLGNTTIRESVKRGVEDDRNRANLEVENQVAQQRASVGLQRAGATERMGFNRADMLERFYDQYPDTNQLSQLAAQVGSGNAAQGGRARTTIGPGSSNYGSQFRATSSGGGGSGGGSGVQTFTNSGGGSSGGGGGVQTFTNRGGGYGGGGGVQTFGGGGPSTGGTGAGAVNQGTQGSVSQFGQGAGQLNSDFDNQFLGQNVYSGGDTIGQYAGGGRVNLLDDLNWMGGTDFEGGTALDPNRIPDELGGNADEVDEGEGQMYFRPGLLGSQDMRGRIFNSQAEAVAAGYTYKQRGYNDYYSIN